MAELKCKTCGTVLDPDPEFCHAVLADGTKYARCPTCSTPYKVPKGKVNPKPEAEAEAQAKAEAEAQAKAEAEGEPPEPETPPEE